MWIIWPLAIFTSHSLGMAGYTILVLSRLAAWTSVAIFGPFLVFPGLWGAVLSSAFGSVLGGPRVLQALAADGLATFADDDDGEAVPRRRSRSNLVGHAVDVVENFGQQNHVGATGDAGHQ